MSFKILVADDNIRDSHNRISELPALLSRAGYEVLSTDDGDEVYDLVLDQHPDLVVLDIHFSNREVDGIEICQALRNEGCHVPIILITAVRDETEDVLRGFEAGADDYVIRARDNREILARIRANLPPEVVEVEGYLRIDFEGRRVWLQREGAWVEIRLQRLQFELLHVLVANAGLVVLSTTLKERVWGKDVSDSVLALYIWRLRHKLEPDPDNPLYIETVRGLGYRFNGQPLRSRAPDAARR